MSVKKRGLGRSLGDLGLSELLSDGGATPAPVPLKDNQLNELPIDALTPGRYQPRQVFKEEPLQELADSIKEQGIIQPIVARQIAGDQYEIIAGERRWRAAKLAGLTDVPVVVKALSDQSAIAMSLIENIQRQDLNVIEESIALQRLVSEFDLTHQQVAKVLGKSRTAVTNLLRLLNLNVEVRKMLEQSKLEMGHARALLGLDDLQQVKVAHYVFEKKLSVREAERFIKRLKQADKSGAPAAQKNAKADPDVTRLIQSISDKLHAHVEIDYNTQGKGKLIVHFNSLDELDGVLSHIH